MKFIKIDKNLNKGFALLLSIIISSVVLAIGVSILKISVSQIQLSATARESEIAFQASQSLTECLTYFRFIDRNSFLARPGPVGTYAIGTQLNAPRVRCMGQLPIESYAEIIRNQTDRHIVRFHYVYSWGNPELCSSANMYIMVPLTSQIVHTFRGTSVGDNGDGNKRCEGGSVCTLIISQGYNRPCNQLQTSDFFTIQRELTTEF